MEVNGWFQHLYVNRFSISFSSITVSIRAWWKCNFCISSDRSRPQDWKDVYSIWVTMYQVMSLFCVFLNNLTITVTLLNLRGPLLLLFLSSFMSKSTFFYYLHLSGPCVMDLEWMLSRSHPETRLFSYRPRHNMALQICVRDPNNPHASFHQIRGRGGSEIPHMKGSGS